MKMRVGLRNYPITKLQDRSRGYVLITLMLFFSLLAIAALAVLPDIANQVKRDREEELIHRGLGYSRGIRSFYKKFGRYPTRIEELENTNNLRFVRKRYKDPVTGQDFKILRMGDVALGNGMMVGQMAPGLQAQPGGQSPLGGGVQARSVLGSNPTQLSGQQTQVTNTGTSDAAGGDTGNPSDTQTDSGSSGSGDTSSSTQQVFGGGPMLGVVSTNKGQTIREFCNKSHYKDWYFIYDPTSDRGGTINSPWCPGQINQGFGTNPMPSPAGAPSPPNTGAPGTVSPTPNQPNPEGDLPVQQ